MKKITMHSNGFHYHGESLALKNRFRKTREELCGPKSEFRLVYWPIVAYRGGSSGSGDIPGPLGHMVKYPDGAWQADVVVVQDAASGAQLAVVDDQKAAHTAVKQLLYQRQPKPARLPGNGA
jgi:hypothetical protein